MAELNTILVTSESPPIIRLSYGVEKANTYIIEDNCHAVLIDASSERVIDELRIRNIVPDYMFLTHEHCDHIWGVNAIRSENPTVQVVAQKYCSYAIGNPEMNKSKLYHIYATMRFGKSYQNEEAKNRKYCCAPAEIVYEDQFHMTWHGCEISCFQAPGHSPGSVLINIKGVGTFSGDSILLDGTFLNFDDGDKDAFYNITLPRIKSIPDEMLVFPGHGDVFRMGERPYEY